MLAEPFLLPWRPCWFLLIEPSEVQVLISSWPSHQQEMHPFQPSGIWVHSRFFSFEFLLTVPFCACFWRGQSSWSDEDSSWRGMPAHILHQETGKPSHQSRRSTPPPPHALGRSWTRWNGPAPPSGGLMPERRKDLFRFLKMYSTPRWGKESWEFCCMVNREIFLFSLSLFFPPFFQIQTFNVDAPCQTVEDLTNGVVMAQVLQKM